MIAPVVGRGEPALGIDRPAKLATPDHQRVVEQTALLQILDECRGGLVGVPALGADLIGQVEVLVPAHMIELDEADTSLGEPAGQQAVSGITARDRKSTRLNSSHLGISYAVFCLKKKKN